MAILPFPTYSHTMESICCDVPVTSNLAPRTPQILRLESLHMDYNMAQSGERIQQLRIQHGYTQEEFAKVLNIDRSSLSRIESGRRGCSLDLLVQLSATFGVTLDYLVFGPDKPDWVTNDSRDRLKAGVDWLIDQLETFRSTL